MARVSAPDVLATSRGTYHPLLGTNVEVRVTAGGDAVAQAMAVAAAAEGAVVAEMERLQGLFSVYDRDSELCRWRSGRLDPPSAELGEVLAAAQRWWQASGGGFHPAAGALRRLWLEAGGTVGERLCRGERPPAPYRLGGGGLDAQRRSADCSAGQLAVGLVTTFVDSVLTDRLGMHRNALRHVTMAEPDERGVFGRE